MFADRLKKLITKKNEPSPETEQDAGLSLAMPEHAFDSRAKESWDDSEANAGSMKTTVNTVPGVAAQTDADMGASDLIALPLLGRGTVAQHQQRLFALLVACLVGLAIMTFFVVNHGETISRQLGATGQALTQSQRLAKSVSQAMFGVPKAFPEVAESSAALAKTIRGLRSGDEEMRISALDQANQGELEKSTILLDRAEKNAAIVMAQQKVLTQAGIDLQLINRESAGLLERAQAVASLKLQQGAAAPEVAAASELVMLTQRIGKSANEFLTIEGVRPETVLLLGQDLKTFVEVARALLEGNAEMRLPAARDEQTREQLNVLIKRFERTRVQAESVLGNLNGLAAARQAQALIVADSEPMRRSLEDLQGRLASDTRLGWPALIGMIAAALAALACAWGLFQVQLRDSLLRNVSTDEQRVEAERQKQEARRVNDANQAAILRLMNELQAVAEGDLTQVATVTEDITGAIADSVNYTVEELRSLVGSVQNTADRVAQTTAEVDMTSTELLAASNEQLHEIKGTGQSVVDMASRINQVSAQAQESALVAQQSLEAADSGLKAVQNAIGGMNSIRDQIQETSKRIKRLGESSQEIGEITELISDITEQTNVLALNAAIQAASAGDAGRGFSVVAEEVQRLAERSADATRQIAALVKAIQTDTQDAIAAMERSTQGVVEGAKLSDTAGTALTDIDRVSRRLSDLIQQISTATSREADLANEVADNIQHIFAVTEQTGEGTKSTAAQVRELSRMAEELRQSVSRFKIS